MTIISFEELINKCKSENKKIYEIALEEESIMQGDNFDVIKIKILETLIAMKDAIKNGADEIDMVINIGMLKEKKYDDILNEIKNRMMKSYLPKGLKSNYDKYPVVQVAGHQDDCICGWDRIVRELKGKLPENSVLAVECYQGVLEDEVAEALVKGLGDVDLYRTGDFMKSEKELYAILGEDITDDRIFGFITRRTMDVYFDEDKVAAAREKIRESAHARPQVVLGVGASYVCREWGLLAYLDMARWEIQQRFRKNLVSNVGFANRNENAGLKYKQGFFVDWRICDRWKKHIIRKVDWFVDTNTPGEPKMIPSAAFFAMRAPL